jgi:hypothetical protein
MTSDERSERASKSESGARPTKRSSGDLVEVVAFIPVLALKAGVAFLRLKARRKKGVKVFRRQLKHSGLSKNQIRGLVADYERIGRLRSYLPGDLRGFRFMRS